MKWLDYHARDEKDLLLDDKGFFIEMGTRSKIRGLRTTKKVYLPHFKSYNEYY